MIFVTADRRRPQLEKLTRLLVSAFPGSTIYQHTDPLRVVHDVMNHKVDAVFLEAEMGKINGTDFLRMLRRQKPDVPVFVIAESEAFCEWAEKEGANGCFALPNGEQQLLDAIGSVIHQEKTSR